MTSTLIWELPAMPDPLESWADGGLPTDALSVDDDAPAAATVTSLFPTADAAITAADRALDGRPGVLAYVTEDLTGSGFQWHRCDDTSECAAEIDNNWIVAVRAFDGEWLRFLDHGHAREFLQIELGIVESRHNVLALFRAEHKDRQLPAAVQWAKVLTTLRAEREQLFPTN